MQGITFYISFMGLISLTLPIDYKPSSCTGFDFSVRFIGSKKEIILVWKWIGTPRVKRLVTEII